MVASVEEGPLSNPLLCVFSRFLVTSPTPTPNSLLHVFEVVTSIGLEGRRFAGAKLESKGGPTR